MAKEVTPEELVLAYQDTFRGESGQIVLNHMAQKFGFIGRSTFVNGDPYGTHINEGHRGVMVFIGKMLMANAADQRQAARGETDEG